MFETRTIKVENEDIVLDASKLQFSEATLSEYLETEGGWMDYFGSKLADAERELARMELEVEKAEDEYDRVYYKVFAAIKDGPGGSDKLVEGKAKVDSSVVDERAKVLDLKILAIECKHNVRSLYQHLRAWEKNHENAQNRGNTLRKELERLHKDRVYDDKIDEIIKSV
jgi:hypothetical protein